MNKKELIQQERGQSLVLVALAMVGLMAFAGLALDGGLAYATRRIAQNAADSGAIAGTYELHRQIWEEQFNANELNQDQILSEIHQAVESHDVPDTDGIPGNEYNSHVRAFYVSRGGGGGGSCSTNVNNGFQELCQLDPDNPCDPTDVQDVAVGISIEVDMPFEPIFAGFIGWDQISVSNRATDFDQRTAAVVNAGDRGFNNDLWAIFAMNHGETTGPSTNIGVDPVFQPPVGFAFSNVHSQGTFSVGNHPPINGQVTYCTPGGCSNCFNALIVPEQKGQTVNLPDFNQFVTLAQARATANNTVLNGNTTWGGPIDQIGPDNLIPDGVYVINGNLTVDVNTLAATQYLFVYVTGDVTIDGFFTATEISIIAEGTITINGTLRNSYPYPRNFSDDTFSKNVAVLWSNKQGGGAINITGQFVNTSSFFTNNDIDIRGAVLAENANINVASNNINTTVRGALIGINVLVSSNAQTGTQTNIQYNGFYFPEQPDRIELLR